jgi:hypothetical protein
MATKAQKIGRRITCGFAAVLAFCSTYNVSLAETRVFGCHFVHRYGTLQANMALAHARKIVGSNEATNLYHQYVGLKEECHNNPHAKRAVHISPELAKLAKNY